MDVAMVNAVCVYIMYDTVCVLHEQTYIQLDIKRNAYMHV